MCRPGDISLLILVNGHLSYISDGADLVQILLHFLEVDCVPPSPGGYNRDLKWQYQGGKKRKWTDYDDECQEKLDYAAYAAKETADLTIDDWFYTVTFENMEQYSHEHGTIRYVRQVYVNMVEG